MNLSHRMRDPVFFQGEDVVQLSKSLLGKFLATEIEGIRTIGKIVEVEAYDGTIDKACHAYLNKRTKRTEIMFAQGGHAYVYLCYGIHHLFNIVTASAGIPHAILLRGIEPVENIDTMLARRNMQKLQFRLTAGPGVLSKAMGISTALNGINLIAPNSPIWLEDRGLIIADEDIIAAPRIGVDYAEECALWPWRFYIKDNKWVSKK